MSIFPNPVKFLFPFEFYEVSSSKVFFSAFREILSKNFRVHILILLCLDIVFRFIPSLQHLMFYLPQNPPCSFKGKDPLTCKKSFNKPHCSLCVKLPLTIVYTVYIIYIQYKQL